MNLIRQVKLLSAKILCKSLFLRVCSGGGHWEMSAHNSRVLIWFQNNDNYICVEHISDNQGNKVRLVYFFYQIHPVVLY